MDRRRVTGPAARPPSVDRRSPPLHPSHAHFMRKCGFFSL